METRLISCKDWFVVKQTCYDYNALAHKLNHMQHADFSVRFGQNFLDFLIMSTLLKTCAKFGSSLRLQLLHDIRYSYIAHSSLQHGKFQYSSGVDPSRKSPEQQEEEEDSMEEETDNEQDEDDQEKVEAAEEDEEEEEMEEDEAEGDDEDFEDDEQPQELSVNFTRNNT